MAKRTLPMLADPEAKKILRELCKAHSLSMDLLTSLLNIQRDNLGRGRQVGITQEFSAVIADFLDADRGD
jgi:hypothetical protein